MALNGDHFVRCSAFEVTDVCVELIERFAADSARTAVFEEEDRTFPRLRNGVVELVNV